MSSVGTTTEWIVFSVIVLGMLALDLFGFSRKAHKVSLKEAGIWSTVWICLALSFAAYVYIDNGSQRAVEYLTAWLVEKSLSVDNLFVFIAIFNYFAIPPTYQHRVLFWGVIGALVMRLAFIAAGAALLAQFDWMMYVFGGFLVFTAIKLVASRGKEVDPGKGLAMRIATRWLKTTPTLHGQRFFIKKKGVRLATPLLIVLIVIEFSDVLFAFDSVPAVLAISQDLFIVYTSNVFAILGLRALYFLLAGVMDRLRFLDIGLAVILAFIGVKMLIHEWVHLPIWVGLSVILGILAITVIASLAAGPPASTSD